jgi:hypothetical protein
MVNSSITELSRTQITQSCPKLLSRGPYLLWRTSFPDTSKLYLFRSRFHIQFLLTLSYVYIINHLFLTKVVEKRWPGDMARMNKLSIIEEGYEKKVILGC